MLSTGTRPAPVNGQTAANGGVGTSALEATSPSGKVQGMSRLQRLNAAVRKRSAGAQVLLTEHMQALWHGYKPLTRPDRGLLDRSAAHISLCIKLGRIKVNRQHLRTGRFSGP